MAYEYLSDEQAGRFGAFVVDPTPEELEKFFFLDAAALALARSKRRRHNRLGWSIQWGHGADAGDIPDRFGSGRRAAGGDRLRGRAAGHR